MRRHLSCLSAVVLLLGLVALSVAPSAASAAGTVTVWPDQLVAADTQTANATIKDPGRILLNGSLSGQYYAPVALPAGARVTRLEYLHSNDVNDPGTASAVNLMRSRHAAGSPTSTWFRAERAVGVGVASFLYEKIFSVAPVVGGNRVSPAFRYWVFVYLNGSAHVGSIRVTFE